MTASDDVIARIFDSGKQSRAELREFGRWLREHSPRSARDDWAPDDNHPDCVAVLRAQDAIRIPELVPIRYGRMAESPFRFFRGAATIMAWDLARTNMTGLNVQACGDAHVQNFGMYASPERRVVFDINDFDETLPAPWEFDVKRLTASIVLESREARFDDDYARDAVRIAIGRYRDESRTLANASSLDIHYAIVDEHNFFQASLSEKVSKYMAGRNNSGLF